MNDEHIIQLYFARDEDAIQATQDKYGPYCSAIAHNILGDPREAEECVNDAWLHCWNAIPPQRPLSLSRYAGRLTRHQAVSRRRAPWTRLPTPASAGPSGPPGSPPACVRR